MHSYALPPNKAYSRPMGWNFPDHPILGVLTLTSLSMVFIGIFCAYQGVAVVMQALSDKLIRYAFSIPFVK